jgi:hypothetical protein
MCRLKRTLRTLWTLAGVGLLAVTQPVPALGANPQDLQEVQSGERGADLPPVRPLLEGPLSPLEASDLTTRVVDLMQENTDGVVGIYLKEIGGGVRAAFNEETIFEPASAIKVLIHLHGMLQVQNTSAELDDDIDWLAASSKFDANGNYQCGGSDCYSNNTVPQTDTRSRAHRLMMECSDNALTQALRDAYGDDDIDETIYDVLELSADTQLNHSIGCGSDAVAHHNQLTLVDLAQLHEEVAMGLLDSEVRQVFYNLMSNNRGFINSVIDQEGAGLGLTSDEVSSFKSQVSTAWKGGSYGLSDGSYRSLGGWLRLPFPCSGVDREYFYGDFIDQATDLDLQDTGSNLSVFAVAGELLRDEIHAALESVVCARPPEVMAPPPLELECSVEGGVTSNDPAVLAWLAGASATDECDAVTVELPDLPNLLPATCDPEGVSTEVVFTSTDTCGSVGQESSFVTVLDTTAPTVDCAVDTESLWPPNHRWVDVGLSFAASDVCDAAPLVEIGVTSDEAPIGRGAGGPEHCADAVIQPDGTVLLRAERSGTGDGRVYEITVSATDACGHRTTCQVQVEVPKNQGKHGAAVDSGQVFDATACAE